MAGLFRKSVLGEDNFQESLNKLRRASWRRVQFLVEEVETTGGQKTVTHLYPNSDRRTVENLGGFPEAYEVQAIVHGADYFQTKKALRNALREAGEGVFIHPWDGEVKCFVDGQYSYTETDTQLGVTVFSFRLVVASPVIIPEAELTNLADIQALADAAQIACAEGVPDEFKVSDLYPQNFSKAQTQLEDLTRFINKKRSVFVQATSAISDVTRVVDNFTDSIAQLINVPAQLGVDLIQMYQSLRSLYTTPKERFDAFLQFFGFGDNDVDTSNTTVARTEAARNTSNIRNTANCTALVEAYRAAVEVDYDTVEQIEEASDALEVQFQSIFDNTNLDDATELGLTVETIASVDDLRIGVQTFLNNKKLTAAQLVDIQSAIMPVQILSFRYYGTSENADEIISINNLTDPSFAGGPLTIVSE